MRGNMSELVENAGLRWRFDQILLIFKGFLHRHVLLFSVKYRYLSKLQAVLQYSSDSRGRHDIVIKS